MTAKDVGEGKKLAARLGVTSRTIRKANQGKAAAKERVRAARARLEGRE